MTMIIYDYENEHSVIYALRTCKIVASRKLAIFSQDKRFTIIFTSIRYQWLRVKARLMEARAIRNTLILEANMNSKSCVNCRLNKRLHTARKESSRY